MVFHSRWAQWPVTLSYLCIFAIIIFDIYSFVASGQNSKLLSVPLPFQYSIVALTLFFVLKSLGASIVRYADDGEVMEFYIEYPLLKYTSGNLIKRYDFPKHKLVGYKIKRKGLRKVVELKMTRGEKSFKKANIPITFLLPAEKQAFKNSLNHILAKNKNG